MIEQVAGRLLSLTITFIKTTNGNVAKVINSVVYIDNAFSEKKLWFKIIVFCPVSQSVCGKQANILLLLISRR